jgi:hypothetical protein
MIPSRACGFDGNQSILVLKGPDEAAFWRRDPHDRFKPMS